jgi:DNA-binding transcriptional MerR regulator
LQQRPESFRTMFRVQQFAKLAHVTVRTLHHYDRLGLLKPSARSDGGYRLYRQEDLGRLEKILVLKYLGMPLREIAELLDAKRGEQETLGETLERQSHVLRERREGLDRVLRAVESARRQMVASAEPDWLLCQNILKEIEMQETQKWSETYYSPEARQGIAESAKTFTPEMQAEVSAKWTRMYADVQSALDRGVAPASDEGRALAARWMALVGAFTGGKPQVLEGLNKLYADRGNWPKDAMTEEQKAMLPKAEYTAFVRSAMSNE